MTRRLTRLSPAAVCATLTFGLVACSSTLDMNSVSKAVSEDMSSRLSLPIAEVICPTDPRTVKAGDVFECLAKPRDGGLFTVKVTQADDKGHVTWDLLKSDGLINLTAVEQLVVKGLKEQAGVSAAVSCGGKFRPATGGETFECLAKIPDHADIAIVVTMKDDRGGISWAVKP
jgi:hypothetical protein